MDNKLKSKFDALEKQRAALVAYLLGSSQVLLNKNPDSLHWSPLQIIQHLILAEELSLKSVKAKLLLGKFEKAGAMAMVREIGLILALRSPIKYAAPAAVSKLPENLDLNLLIEQWEKVRMDWKELLESIESRLLMNYLFKHPVAGKLKLGGGLSFMYEHVNRHEKQIKMALKQI